MESPPATRAKRTRKMTQKAAEMETQAKETRRTREEAARAKEAEDQRKQEEADAQQQSLTEVAAMEDRMAVDDMSAAKAYPRHRQGMSHHIFRALLMEEILDVDDETGRELGLTDAKKQPKKKSRQSKKAAEVETPLAATKRKRRGTVTQHAIAACMFPTSTSGPYLLMMVQLRRAPL